MAGAFILIVISLLLAVPMAEDMDESATEATLLEFQARIF